jgi:ketosteroid isomerase-like protein
MNPATVVERYLALIADPTADLEAIGDLLHPDMRFVERPNLVSPQGTERDPQQILASVLAGRRLLSDQRFDVLDHLVAGDRVATRVAWTGTLAAGPWLRADSSMHFTVRDGRIAHQENYDCFHPHAPRSP